jgi:predicted Zn finger-like uncharacterized protein
MDVTCERCSTAYEFDDALVSERGTTVKCTSCGHQFKVRRPQPAGAPERWLVRTIDGRELEFRALRELQAAIGQAVITRDDVLSRGGSRPRRLGSIAELEPFFASAGASVVHSTSLGLGPRAPLESPGGAGQARGRPPQVSRPEVSVAIPLPRGPADETVTSPFAPSQGSRRPSVPPAPPRPTPPPAAAPLPGVIVAPTGAPPVPAGSFFDEETTHARPSSELGKADVSAPTAPFEIGNVLEPVKVRALRDDWAAEMPPGRAAPEPPGPPRPPRRPPPPAPPPPAADEVTLPRDVAGARPKPSTTGVAVDSDEPLVQDQHTASVPPLTPTPGIVRQSYVDDLGDPRYSEVVPRRSGAVRWISGVVVVGMLGLAGATVGRKMLVTAPQAASAAGDSRIGALLAEGEKSLADGDLESAKEQFDKASVLGEREPRAVADLARLAATKADVEWLRQRLLPPHDAEQATAQRELEEATQRARKAAERAADVAPSELSVLRSRIDALRLSGDLAGARKLVAGIASASGQPDNALALAELDLAETKPDWPTVLGRLRTALTTDNNLGRARSMLVYALARSGDISGARAELDRLAALPRPHPLVSALRTFLNRSSASVDPSSLPDASAKPSAGKPSASAPSPAPAPAAAAPAPREPRERPVHNEPREPREHPAPEEHLPSAGPVDTSDLPGVKAPPTPQPTAAPTTPPAPPPAAPPGVDTSDLPGFK